ncbi:hypothetical protein GGP41_010593 [Bipolaris sorokiniana]|uniref:Cytochrome b5 heme-binding domain-containing protein n=1 Tax=Cochliobolus sativus TaxID=45130 RepID=A0A8H5ZKD5_COCSA|nr:hypothetical protein GGP41_010593 [Bipolaris sorokiniana]
MAKRFSTADVASHKTANDLWIIVDEDVYDLTKFQDDHPGGKKILQRVAGKDASKQFWKYHNESILKKYQKQLQVGSLDTKAAPPAPPAAAAPEMKEIVKPEANPGVVAPQPTQAAEEPEPFDSYGDLVPYADPSWYQTYHSPYYNETHAALRAEVRDWVEEKLMPYVTEWDEAKKVPDEIFLEMGARGYLAGMLGVKYPTQYTDLRVKSVPPEKWDHFHEMIITDEISRTGSGGLVWGLIGGYGIGGPPLFKFGKKELVQRIGPDLLSGKKRICLAITEPDAGSDVANLTCEAKLSEDGKHYIVNGEKKWITNGIWSDYFTTANFNHERIGIIIQCLRFSRVCYEESMKYAHKRKTFGKRLIDHPVIRLKLAHMARQIEASYNWMENLIYQCEKMDDMEAMLKLGGAIASLKAQSTTTFEFCAREASQIFGGLSYSRGGQGAKVERLYRDVRAYAIPGGSEEIMLDLSIRQALRVHKVLGMKL